MKSNKMHQASWERWILGTLFLAMAIGQVASFPIFVQILETYQFLPLLSLPLWAGLIITAELLAGIGLLISNLSKQNKLFAATCGVIVAVFWTLLGLQAFLRGLDIQNCGCFGAYLGQPLRWWILLEDVIFVIVAVRVYNQINK